MTELESRIADLSNPEAIQVTCYVAECLRQQLQAGLDTPIVMDDNQAASLLGNQFPEAASTIESIRPGADDALRAQTARQFLAACAEEAQYAVYVQDAIDQLAFKCDPLTLMAVTAGIIFLMQLKFKATAKIHTNAVNGSFEIGKNPTSEGLLRRILPANPLSKA
jgi:hypothetical protein